MATYPNLDPYFVAIPVVDLWIFRSVADPAKNSCLASVCASDNQDPEAAKLFLDILEVLCISCRHFER